MKIIELKSRRQATHLSSEKIESICRLLQQLYPNLSLTHSDFVDCAEKRIVEGYHFLLIVEGKKIIGLCGFNIYDSFAWGKYMYIYDLVIDDNQRSKNFGLMVLSHLEDFAKINQCCSIHLDSKLDRIGARKFYIKNGFDIFAFHYTKNL